MKFLVRHATWRNTIILLCAQFAVQALILFLVYPLLGGEGRPLDMRSNLTGAEALEYIAGIGAHGRMLYAVNEGTLDVLYPVLYSAAYAFLFLRLIMPMAGSQSAWLFLGLLPFCIAAADLSENLSIIGAVLVYPNSSAWLPTIVLSNALKGLLILLTAAALLLTAFARLGSFLCRERRKTGRATDAGTP